MHLLPEEILSYIISLLNNSIADVPSVFNASLDPNKPIAPREQHSIKPLSLVSRKFRRLTIPFLFKHCRISVARSSAASNQAQNSQEAGPSNYDYLVEARIQQAGSSTHLPSPPLFLESLYKFVDHHNLRSSVEAVAIYYSFTPEPTIKFASPGKVEVLSWQQFFTHLRPRRLILHASPTILASFLNCGVDVSDAWAFNIPFQRVELELANFDASKPTAALSLYDLPIISLAYNEGSSLNAYGTYHYFEKSPPCIINSSLQLPRWDKLRAFAYTALFPHLTHFSALCRVLLLIPSLRALAVQLAPGKDSPLLDDFEWIGRGNLSLRDCWNEIEGAYRFLVRAMLTIDDGIAESDRNMQKARIDVFTSYDYDRDLVRKELDGVLMDAGSDWSMKGKYTWCRTRTEDFEPPPWFRDVR